MQAHKYDIGTVCKKLKRIRNENAANVGISSIQTLNGLYTNNNVLEGFRKNTELLCNDDIESNDHEFYNNCVEDNMHIFEIANTETYIIPHMTLTNLKDIIFKKLKLNKACDIYKLSVEHLRHAGDQILEFLLKILNSIIENLNHLSQSQLNTAIASVIYKGKEKPKHEHKSYRQVRVKSLIGRCLDEFIRPNLITLTKPIQNSSQYGSYISDDSFAEG